MDIQREFTRGIVVGKRHRALDRAKVKALAGSMELIGLQQPITLFVQNDKPHLVTGLHRLLAARILGWEFIDCVYVKMSPIDRELWEISENLHRVDLSKEQRDAHIRRYAELLEARDAASISQQNAAKLKTDSNPKGAGRPEGTASKVAKETGLSKDTVRRALKPKKAVKQASPRPVKSEEDIIREEANAIIKAWNAARPAARELAMEEIDTPLMDTCHAA